MTISLIVAIAQNMVIGSNNQLPWHISEDLQYFKKKTLHRSILMGRKTFESFTKPLPQRTSLILTRNTNYPLLNDETCKIIHSLNQAIELCQNSNQTELFVIGGCQIYKEALACNLIHKVYLSKIHNDYIGDTTFPYTETIEEDKSYLSFPTINNIQYLLQEEDIIITQREKVKVSFCTYTKV